MSYLTIRNLSATPLELTLVVRLDPTQVAALSSSPNRSGFFGIVSNFFRALLRAPLNLLGSDGVSNGNGNSGAEPPFGQPEITSVRIEPFETRTTDIRPPTDPKRAVLRLTFAASSSASSNRSSNGRSNGTASRTYHRDHRSQPAATTTTSSSNKQLYTVVVPPASPCGLELMPVSNGKMDEKGGVAAPSFTAVYTPEKAHLAIMSKAPLTSWMGDIDGSWPLSSLSLPGTHNSPACHRSFPSVRCQAVDIKEQLEHGARFLDVRVGVNPTPKQKPGHKQKPPTDPRFTLVHSVWSVSIRSTRYFKDLYATVCDFLDAHPTETVLISLKCEGATKGTDADLALQLLDYYVGRPQSSSGSSSLSKATSKSSNSRQRWYTEPRVPTLDEVRGKIVLVRRFRLPKEDSKVAGAAAIFKQLHAGRGFGLDASEWPDNCPDGCCDSGVINLQDFYGVMQTSLIEQKLEYCRAQFERAANQCYYKITTTAATSTTLQAGRSLHGTYPPLPPLYMNFLSASNFFNSSCWPEKIAARINPAIVDYLCMEHGEAAKTGAGVNAGTVAMGDNSTGLVVLDWVGVDGDWDLIRCIIAWNARLQLKS